LNKINSYKINTIASYSLAFLIGIGVGLRTFPDFIGLIYFFIAVACIFLAFQNNVKALFSVLPYLIYTEMYIRAYVPKIPYLFLPYLFISIFLVLIIRSGTNVRLHSRVFIFLVFYLIVELISSTRSNNTDVARGILVNSVLLVVAVIWASYNFFSPKAVYDILNNIKYASIYLCGVVLARYLLGDVSFSGHSGSEGTNGLAPVQISGYVGFSCTIFFFSIMSELERKKILINLVLFSVCATIMLLSFSRGGVYFIGVMMVLYFFFNRTAIKSYFSLLLVVPFGLLIYYYASEKTGGLIEQRYEQEGSSGRDLLVKAGWTIFMSQPLVGVGTGNYNSEIKEQALYSQESGAHDEFIRVVAEDGLLGIVTYWVFFVALFFSILRRSKIQREYGVYFLVFFCLVIIHNGLKISLQPFLLTLAVATPTVMVVKKKKHVTTADPQLTV